MNKFTAIATGLLVAALVAIFILLKTISNQHSQYNNLQKDYAIVNDSVHHYKDYAGVAVAQTKVLVLNSQQLKQDGVQMKLQVKDLKKQVGDLNNLVNYWKGHVDIKGHIDTVYQDKIIYTKDSTKEVIKTLQWSNKYLSFHQTYYPLTNKIDMDYQYKLGLQVTVYTKRHGLFKKPELLCDVRVSDPGAKIDSSAFVVIDKTKKRPMFWIGFGAGVVSGVIIKKELEK